MADHNAVGCPLLPGEDVADDGDECADDISQDQAEALERQLFAKEEKENILHNGFTTPDNAFGEDRTMGISSWLRKTNARQIRNRHHAINKAKEAIRKKDTRWNDLHPACASQTSSGAHLRSSLNV